MEVDEASGGRRSGAVPPALGAAGTPLRTRTGAADGRRIGVLVDARSDGRRTLDVAQDARVVPCLGPVVEMRRRRESQQRERKNGSPRQQCRPASPHGCLVARFARARQGRDRAGRPAPAARKPHREPLARPPAGEGMVPAGGHAHGRGAAPRPSSGTAPRSSPGPRGPSRGPDPRREEVWFRYGTFRHVCRPSTTRCAPRAAAALQDVETSTAPGHAGGCAGSRRSPRQGRTRRRSRHDRRTENADGATRAERGRGGGGNDRMGSIRRRQPAHAAPERPRIRSARIRTVRRQAGAGAGRPRSPGRLRAPRGR